MTLIFDARARRLTDEHNIPVTCLALKRGDIAPISISVVGANTSATVGLYAKPVGDYSVLPLIAVSAVGNPVALTPQTNTERINTALGVGTDHELDRLDMMCEIVYSEAGKQVATATLNLVLHNNVARPGLPDPSIQDDPYSGGDIPIATVETPGKVKPDGTTITIAQDGTISATDQSAPIATTATTGIVKPDGESITITADGKISAKDQSTPLATSLVAGKVKPDGATITVAADGTIAATAAADPQLAGNFTGMPSYAESISLKEGYYEIDIVIDTNFSTDSSELTIKFGGVVVPASSVLITSNVAGGGIQGGVNNPITLNINQMISNKLARVNAIVSAYTASQGAFELYLSSPAITLLSATYRRLKTIN